MKKFNKCILPLLFVSALVILLMDTKTAISGTLSGIELCSRTLVPALFPFLVLSAMGCHYLMEIKFKPLIWILRPCCLPQNSEMIFLVGILAGYPVGAKLIWEAYKQGKISIKDAQRMLMFCNNAGPSFLFGVLGQLLNVPWIPWVMWFTQIISAYFIGIITAQSPIQGHYHVSATACSISGALTNAIRSLSTVCGWVILFRIILAFLNKWFLYACPPFLRVLLSGSLELSNGCILLPMIENNGVRFMIGLIMVTFGGFCITMQTSAVTPGLSLKYYLRGKQLQCGLAALLGLPFFVHLSGIAIPGWIYPILWFPAILVIIVGLYRKKVVAIRKIMLYNSFKS